MEMNQNVLLRASLLKPRDALMEQEELDYLKAIEQGLIDAKENRTVSLSDARKRLGLTPSSYQSL